MARKKTEFLLTVFYGDEIDEDFERLLEKTLGPRSGSGFELETGQRDLEWTYPTPVAAKAAVQRLTDLTIAMHRLKEVVLQEWTVEEEEGEEIELIQETIIK